MRLHLCILVCTLSLIFLGPSTVSANSIQRLFGSLFESDDEDIIAVGDVTDTCRNYAAWGQCGFYECLEARFPCGEDGFATNVGLHFCQKRAQTARQLDVMGRRWRNVTSVCLMHELLEIYESDISSCGEIKRVGGSAIATCNERTAADGTTFCDFVRNNADAYRSTFQMSDVGRLVSLDNPRVLSQMFLQSVRCGAGRVLDRLTGTGRYLTGVLSRLFD